MQKTIVVRVERRFRHRAISIVGHERGECAFTLAGGVTDNAVDVVALGGQHDDRYFVAEAAQPAADRQAVFAGQHQVQHDQVDRFTREQAVERLRIFGQQDFETLLAQVAAQQIADARIVIDHEHAVGTLVGSRGGHLCIPRHL